MKNIKTKRFLNGLAKFTAVLFAILFVLSLVLSLFLYNIEKNAFNAEIYINAFQEEGVYDRLPAVIGEQLLITMRAKEKSDLLLLTKNLTAKDWEFFITALIPPKELKISSEETIEETLAFLNGDTEKAKLSFRSFKERLASEEAVNALMAFINAQAPCTITELLQLANAANEETILCKPPEISMPLVKNIVSTQLKAASATIPDEKTFLEREKMGADFSKFQSLRVFMRFSLLLPVLFLLLITLLVVRSLFTWLRWWGIPLLTAGSITLVLSLILAPVLQLFFSTALAGNTPIEISKSLLQLINDIFSTITRQFLNDISLYAFIVSIFGFGMVIGSKFLTKTKKATEVI